MPTQTTLRAATPNDVPTLVEHRHLMFEDMRASEGLQCKDSDLDKMDSDYAAYLRDRIGDGSIRAWVAEADGAIVASGCVSMLAWPPGPNFPPVAVGLLHSMYTAGDYRKRGIAASIVKALASACKANGCRHLILGGRGTKAGRHLYETLGFRPSENSRLNL